MKVSEQSPEPHRKYIVRRGGVLYTATPCYGMHKPYWIVRIMGKGYEAPPEPMLPDDEWEPAESQP